MRMADKQMTKALKKISTTGAWLGMMLFLASCTKNPNSPGVEYMPDMYRSPSYETYAVNALFADSSAARTPVARTITMGEWPYEGNLINALPYPFENTTEDYNRAGEELKNPLPESDSITEQGKVIFEKMCIQCHGMEGKGDGTMVKNDKYPPPPSYSGPLKELSEGKMFHSITYGKNFMGSHASQLTKVERWEVIRYIQVLQKL